MALFIKNGKIKSTLLLNSFMLSLVYVAVYVFFFAASTGILEKVIHETAANVFAVWLPPVAVSALASVVCALPLFFAAARENRNFSQSVTGAFILIAVYAAFMIAFLFSRAPAESRAVLVRPLVFYFALPAVTGNIARLVIGSRG
jgi:hypothetical protein